MAINPLEPPPPDLTGLSESTARWLIEVHRRITDATQLIWGQLDLSNADLADLAFKSHQSLDDILGADDTDADPTQTKHISNLQAKTWTDNDAKASDDTDTDPVQDKHISNLQAKTWTDADAARLINPMTTDGDMITQLAGVPARVPIGTEDQVLTVVGGEPAWADAQGGGGGGSTGGWEFVDYIEVTNAPAITITDLGAEPDYEYSFESVNLYPSVANDLLTMRVSQDNGATFETTNYNSYTVEASQPNSIVHRTETTYFLASQISAGPTDPWNVRIVVQQLDSTTRYKQFTAVYSNSADNVGTARSMASATCAYTGNLNAINALQFTANPSGFINGGIVVRRRSLKTSGGGGGGGGGGGAWINPEDERVFTGLENVDWTTGIDDQGSVYKLQFYNLSISTPDDIYVRFSSDGGATFPTSGYNSRAYLVRVGGGGRMTTTPLDGVNITGTVPLDSAADHFASGWIEFQNPADATSWTSFTWMAGYRSSNGFNYAIYGAGEYTAGVAVDAVRLTSQFGGKTLSGNAQLSKLSNKATGTGGGGGAWQAVEGENVFTGVNTVEFLTGIDDQATVYQLFVSDLSTTIDAQIIVELSSDGGATWLNTPFKQMGDRTREAFTGPWGGTQGYWSLTALLSLDNAANHRLSGTMTMYNLADAAGFKGAQWNTVFRSTSGSSAYDYRVSGAGDFLSTAAINAIRIRAAGAALMTGKAQLIKLGNTV